MLKMMPVARRALGENNETTLRLTCCFARALYRDPAVTLDDVRESVTTLEETKQTARRVLGGAHPLTVDIENHIRCARAREELLRARKGDDVSALRDLMAAMPPPSSA